MNSEEIKEFRELNISVNYLLQYLTEQELISDYYKWMMAKVSRLNIQLPDELKDFANEKQ